jgi:hypothetical protein
MNEWKEPATKSEWVLGTIIFVLLITILILLKPT